MDLEFALEKVEKDFSDYKTNNKDEFFKVSGYQHRNMELLYLKRRLAEALCDLAHQEEQNKKITELYVASEYELKKIKND